MTISSVVPVNNYAGNNSSTTFDFDFLIENSEELVVTKSDKSGNIVTLRENVDYSIHETGNVSGSYITFPIQGSSYGVLSEDEVLTLSLELEIKQENSFPLAKNFEPPIVEKALDYIIRLIQILNRKQERSIKVKESPYLDTEELVNKIEIIKDNLDILQSVSSDLQNINSVNANKTNIDIVAGIDDDVTLVSQIAGKITEVSDNFSDINIASNNIESINTVANNISRVNSVSDISSSVACAANISNQISACAENMSSITSALTNAQIAANKANESGLSAQSAHNSEILAKNWASKTDGIVSDGEYSAKYYAIRSRDVSGVSFKELNANLGYIREDVLEDEPRGYNNIRRLKHSLYDIQKFIFCGNPIVNNSGEITFAQRANNYVYVSNDIMSRLAEAKSFRVTWGGVLGTQPITLGDYNQAGSSVNSDLFYVSRTNGSTNNFSLTLRFNNNNTYYVMPMTVPLSYNGSHYNSELIFDGNKYKYLVKLEDGTEISTEYKTSLKLYYNGNGRYHLGELTEGSFDLKQFSITVDGVPVFSGNKTGLDTIKPDNYTVVGSPTITDDGIAINVGDSDKIQIIQDIDFNNDFEIKWNMKITSEQTENNAYFVESQGSTGFQLYHWKGYPSLVVYLVHNSANLLSANIPYSTLDRDYIFKAVNKTFSIGYKLTDESQYTFVDLGTTTEILNVGTGLTFGYYTGSGKISTDLNSFKIYVDGNLVYQPCLKIPYTLSKTGSKIVDAAYRGRVQDVYEQYGNALYYTIDEINKNVTLPMGEVYGFIEKNRENIELNKSAIAIRQTIGDWCTTQPTTASTASLNKPAALSVNYLQHTHGAVKFSDGLIIQWGYFAPTNNTDKRVSLPVPFSSNKYLVLLRLNNQNISMNINCGYYFPHRNNSFFDMQTVSSNYPFDWFAIGY